MKSKPAKSICPGNLGANEATRAELRPFKSTGPMFSGTYLFLLTARSRRRLCTLLDYDISSYKARDMQWIEFLYYIEPIIKASTERTKFGPLLWTKLKQQVLHAPLTQETLYYLSAFWWTRQLRGVTGFSPRHEIYAVTFNHIAGKEHNKPQPPQHFPTEAECKGKNLRNAEQTLLLLPAYALLRLMGTFGKVWIFSFHLSLIFIPNSSTAPHYHHSLSLIFHASFPLLGQRMQKKKEATLSPPFIIHFISVAPELEINFLPSSLCCTCY